MNLRARLVTLAVSSPLCLLSGCASALVLDGRSGTEVTLEAAADELATKDVVFLGEEHDNDRGHELQLELVQLLHQRRPNIAVSMEMFERDVQEDLDRYLRGEIDEDAFLERSRPWRTYSKHYRPVVEYAKAHGIPVLAANMPRPLARKVSKEGPAVVEGDPNVARETTAPRDEYFERVRDAVTDEESDHDKEWVYRLYQAQCYKDDTMAETIVDRLHAARGAEPPLLVVHLCGKFHSDYGAGTAARVRSRDAALQIGVVSMKGLASVSAASIDSEVAAAGDFVLAVPKPKSSGREFSKAVHKPAHGPESVAESSETSQPTTQATSQPSSQPTSQPASQPSSRPSAHVAAEPDPDGRPALGFMPGYEAEGVMVEMLREGGPAERAGLREGDEIVELDGEKVGDIREYMTVLATLTIGKTVAVVVERDGKRVKLEVVVGSR